MSLSAMAPSVSNWIRELDKTIPFPRSPSSTSQMKWIALLLVFPAAEHRAHVGERYQDYVKRHQITSDSLPKDAGGLWRIKHTNGRTHVLVTVFDGVICEERHYPVNRAQADAVVFQQGNGNLKLLVQGIDEVRWSTEDKRLAARFSEKGKYLQVSNPQQVEERLQKYRDAMAAPILKDLKTEKDRLEKEGLGAEHPSMQKLTEQIRAFDKKE